MSFIKKLPPPPDVKEGEVLTAKIGSIDFPVESQFKDDQGQPKQQICFNLRLEDGYEFKSWMAYYDEPSERSKLGILCLTLMNLTKEKYRSVGEALDALKRRGRVYVKCKGFREWQEKLYPKFKVETTKLPPTQTAIAPQPQEGLSKETLEVIKKSEDIIDMGIPLNEKDWNTTVPAAVRAELLKEGLMEEKEGLFFFTEMAKKFL